MSTRTWIAALLVAVSALAVSCVPPRWTPAQPTTTTSTTPADGVIAGAVTTFAGVPGECDVVDGDAATARFGDPYTMAADGTGSLYVIEPWRGVIRRVAPDGSVETLAGALGEPGLLDGTGDAARIGFPGLGTDIDEQGRLVFVDADRGVVRRMSSAGEVETVAGTPNGLGFAFEPERWTGPAADAQFVFIEGVSVDGAALVVSDYGSRTVRRIEDGEVSILWSDGSESEIGRIGSGDLGGARVWFVVPAGDGAFWLAHPFDVVGSLSAEGDMSVLAGQPDANAEQPVDGTGTDARFAEIGSGAVGPDGSFYVPDDHSVRRIDPDGRVTTIAGVSGQPGHADGTGAVARFDTVSALAFGPDGALYASDYENCVIRRIT